MEDVDPRELREESKDARRVRRAFKGRDDERRRTSAQAKKERRASKAEVERSQYGTQRATNVRSKGQPKLRYAHAVPLEERRREVRTLTVGERVLASQKAQGAHATALGAVEALRLQVFGQAAVGLHP